VTGERPWHDPVRRLVHRHRHLLAAGCAGLTVLSALSLVHPPRPRLVPVVTATRRLPAGSRLAAADLGTAWLPPADVPAGSVGARAAVVGAVLAQPVERGEPVTPVQLLGAATLSRLAQRGLVADPVRLADPAVGELLHAGQTVDVLATVGGPDGPAPTTAVVARHLHVLAVPGSAAGQDGTLVLLATTARVAVRLATAAAGGSLSVVLDGG
jgi:pilus assembly protein CpaB